MRQITRRVFVSTAAAGIAAAATQSLDAQRIYHPNDWKLSAFNELLSGKSSVKQVCDIVAISDGSAFDHIVNLLDGLRFGFDIPEKQFKIVAAFRGMANVMTFNDAMWAKYNIGEWLKVNDWKTKKPATRNPFYLSDFGSPAKYPSQDPNDPKSLEQDSSIQALQQRGVRLIACHTAISAMSAGLVQKLGLASTKEEVVADLQANLLPDVLVVPTGVSAISMLQNRGHFCYVRL